MYVINSTMDCIISVFWVKIFKHNIFGTKWPKILLIATPSGDLNVVTLLLVLKTTFVPNVMAAALRKLQEKFVNILEQKWGKIGIAPPVTYESFMASVDIDWSPCQDKEMHLVYHPRGFIGYVVLKIWRHASKLACSAAGQPCQDVSYIL